MKKLRVEIQEDSRALAGFGLDRKRFKTGSRGYHAQGKVEIQGKRYEANFLLVEIGSKPQKRRPK